MKVIKKYFKVILCFMAFAVVSFACAFNPVLNVDAAMTTAKASYNVFINTVKMPRTTVDAGAGQKLEIPLLHANWQDSAATDYTIRVLDPANVAHDYVVKQGADNSAVEDYFDDTDSTKLVVKSLNEGEYSIVYIVNEDGKMYSSNAYTVTVKNVSYALDFSVESATTGDHVGKLNALVPENVKKGSAAIELPVAKVVDSNDNVIPDAVVDFEVTENGARITESTSNSVLSKDADGVYSINPTKEATYKVKYTYKFGSNPATKTFTIVVSDDYEVPESKDITISTPSLPSFELGDTDITLPKLTVSDKYTDNISHNVESIEIKVGDASLTLTNNCYEFDMTKEAFDVDSYAELVGNVKIKYNIRTAYGKEKSIEVVAKNVTDNTKPSVYMAYDYKTTELDKVNTDVAVDLRKEYGYNELYLPAIFAEDKVSEYSEFTFVRYIQRTSDKKIFYVDNKKLEDGVLVDVLPAEDGGEDTGYNYSGDANIGQYNKAVQFQFAKDVEDGTNYAGDYTIGYQVVANTVNKQENYVYESGTTRYKIKVASTATVAQTDKNPTVEINNLKNLTSINSDGSLSINVSGSDDTDARIKYAMFYYYAPKDGAKGIIEDMKAAISAAKNGTTVFYDSANVLDLPAFEAYMAERYAGFKMVDPSETNNKTFDLTLTGYDASVSTTATVVAVALNDAHNFETATRTLNINDLTDNIAPVATVINGGSLESASNIDLTKVFAQGDTVTLPTVNFADADKSLAWDVKYYVLGEDETDINFKATTGKKRVSSTSYTGGTILTGKVGTYYVVYRASDDAGNSTYVYFTFEVEDTSDPILEVKATVEGDDATISGDTITGVNGTTVSFDTALLSSDRKTDYTNQNTAENPVVVEADGLDWVENADGSFTFNDAGEYTITFKGSYVDGNSKTRTAVDQVYHVTITMAELKWDFNVNADDYKQANTNSTVTLPYLTASQGNLKADVDVKVTFDGKDLDAANDIVSNVVNGYTVYEFKTNASKGVYKVVYTATTEYAKIEKTLEIKVGDNHGPSFELKNDYKAVLGQDIVYDGNKIEYQININRSTSSGNTRKVEIVVTRNGKSVYTYNTGLVIKDLDDAGVEINNTYSLWDNLKVVLTSNDNIVTSGEKSGQYFIEGVGTCKLTISSTDNYNNKSEKVVEFKVINETSPKKVNDTVVGIVLIIVSLVILAGVIGFFAFPGLFHFGKKSSNGKAKKVKNSKAKEEITEDVETVEDVVEVESTDSDAKSGDVE